MNTEEMDFFPPEHWARQPEGSPKWEAWRAYRRLGEVVYANDPEPSTVMDYVTTYAYWLRKAKL